VKAYIDVLRQLRLVELSARNEETIQIQLSLEDERVLKGSGIAVDVLQAKSRLQLAKERRITFEGALEDSFSRYTQVFDHPPDIAKMVEPVPPALLIPETLDDAIDAGLAENPAIANSDGMVEMARERRREARADLFPTIDLVGTYKYQKDVDAVRGTRRDISVLLQANWDLFTGLSSRADIAQAAFDYSASRDNNDYVVRKVIEQVKIAWQALRTSRDRLELLENAVNIASEVFESRKKLREAGRETVINVLDAESEIFNARINYASAAFDEKVAVFQLLLAMGRLASPELINARSADPAPAAAQPVQPEATEGDGG
jgi:adhesin transport system outer membrane protein